MDKKSIIISYFDRLEEADLIEILGDSIVRKAFEDKIDLFNAAKSTIDDQKTEIDSQISTIEEYINA